MHLTMFFILSLTILVTTNGLEFRVKRGLFDNNTGSNPNANKNANLNANINSNVNFNGQAVSSVAGQPNRHGSSTPATTAAAPVDTDASVILQNAQSASMAAKVQGSAATAAAANIDNSGASAYGSSLGSSDLDSVKHSKQNSYGFAAENSLQSAEGSVIVFGKESSGSLSVPAVINGPMKIGGYENSGHAIGSALADVSQNAFGSEQAMAAAKSQENDHGSSSALRQDATGTGNDLASSYGVTDVVYGNIPHMNYLHRPGRLANTMGRVSRISGSGNGMSVESGDALPSINSKYVLSGYGYNPANSPSKVGRVPKESYSVYHTTANSNNVAAPMNSGYAVGYGYNPMNAEFALKKTPGAYGMSSVNDDLEPPLISGYGFNGYGYYSPVSNKRHTVDMLGSRYGTSAGTGDATASLNSGYGSNYNYGYNPVGSMNVMGKLSGINSAYGVAAGNSDVAASVKSEYTPNGYGYRPSDLVNFRGKHSVGFDSGYSGTSANSGVNSGYASNGHGYSQVSPLNTMEKISATSNSGYDMTTGNKDAATSLNSGYTPNIYGYIPTSPPVFGISSVEPSVGYGSISTAGETEANINSGMGYGTGSSYANLANNMGKVSADSGYSTGSFGSATGKTSADSNFLYGTGNSGAAAAMNGALMPSMVYGYYPGKTPITNEIPSADGGYMSVKYPYVPSYSSEYGYDTTASRQVPTSGSIYSSNGLNKYGYGYESAQAGASAANQVNGYDNSGYSSDSTQAYTTGQGAGSSELRQDSGAVSTYGMEGQHFESVQVYGAGENSGSVQEYGASQASGSDDVQSSAEAGANANKNTESDKNANANVNKNANVNANVNVNNNSNASASSLQNILGSLFSGHPRRSLLSQGKANANNNANANVNANVNVNSNSQNNASVLNALGINGFMSPIYPSDTGVAQCY